MENAIYYDKLDKPYVRCNLCPNYCIVEDGEVGKCGVRKNNGGILYTLNYEKISSYGYDDIEKSVFITFILLQPYFL